MTATVLSTTEVELEVVLEQKEVIADGVVLLTLRHPGDEPLPEWAPGAHIDLLLRENLVRQYSLCGDPANRAVFQVAVRREQAGRGGSAHVHDELAAGDLVRVRGPRNNFRLVEAPRYLFVAGGIGITPLLPMISAAEQRGADWRLVYGGRTQASMPFADELVARFGDRVSLRPADSGSSLELRKLLKRPGRGTAIYCCGPESLLAEAEKRCHRWRSALHVERFAAAAPADAGPATAFDVELARSGITIRVPENRSILDAVEDAGAPAMSSCREGICGTCETRVLDGTPDHRDSLLTASDRATGETMMICVSRACGSRLVLDL
ncbi:ferredoxin-NADP reductase [Saccharopolyspora erythraea NRRL 2338]|uniref:Phthalate 4,5-dioxygenase reductase subunit n=2 Tax=Saccharopolyspora erythraea TaxID=1836 RepID=A4FCJ8_SACEN|nr:PDR/VanB family oxidoreductase [Saccharopolyspora erythraea]EQD87421.1 ferredoxin [Saccharopolyspora erythraea D]PFG95537.1 ferredoxin-NADP reductase [Saccharopolyspora erythraea NRRL 2338]QRK92161.1 oxidoreductase [Saccharopolyspora erythraea]CAM01773.1 phthalate 4,5-dioxygenase reductase subunit [Saccharopolyspora erythraea NRRL 2338]